jgi:hypothetical protein
VTAAPALYEKGLCQCVRAHAGANFAEFACPQYETPSLQGFEAIGSLLRPLVDAGVYQAVLRQSIKSLVGTVLSALRAVGITRGRVLPSLV